MSLVYEKYLKEKARNRSQSGARKPVNMNSKTRKETNNFKGSFIPRAKELQPKVQDQETAKDEEKPKFSSYWPSQNNSVVPEDQPVERSISESSEEVDWLKLPVKAEPFKKPKNLEDQPIITKANQKLV